jgi:tRNA 2-thiouridine synthesizing protein A
MNVHYDYLVDATGESCPMPLLKAKQRLNKMKEGECVKVIASDKGSVRDFSAFVALTAHELLEAHEEDLGAPCYVYYIIKH